MKFKQVAFIVLTVLCCTVNLSSHAAAQSTDSKQGRSSTSQRSHVSPSVQVKVLRSDKLLEHLGDQPSKASIIEVTLDPLAASPPHRHPGPVTGYVLEGTLEFQIGDEPLRTLYVGDTFFEPTMILHKVARNPDKKTKCRVLVTMIHSADAKRLTIPEVENGSPGPRPVPEAKE